MKRALAPVFAGLVSSLVAGTAGATVSAADAATVHLDTVRVDASGGLEITFRATSKFGEPIAVLDASDVTVRIDGRIASPFQLERARSADSGVDVVVIADLRPPSEKLASAQGRVAAEALASLTPADRLAVVVVADDVRTLAGLGDGVTVARDRLASLPRSDDGGDASLPEAIRDALRLLGQAPLRNDERALIVVSDGRGLSRSAARAIASEAHRDWSRPIAIFAIGLRHEDASDLTTLRELARSARGDYYEDPERAFAEIWERIASSHRLRTTTTEPPRREVQVDVGSASDSRRLDSEADSRSRGDEFAFGIPFPSDPIRMAGAGTLLLLVAWMLGRFARRSRRRLAIETPGGRIVQHRLKRGTTALGRSAQNDIVLDSINVSAHHAELKLARGVAELRDRGSTNGTFVNGRQLHGRQTLAVGDEIRLGDVEMVFQ